MSLSFATAARTTRVLLPVVFVLAIFAAPANAQDPAGQRRSLRPTDHSIALGATRVEEDGESSFRAGLFWYASARLVAGVTTSWGRYDKNIEPELRWFPLSRSSPFFLSGSMICKDTRCGRIGGSLAAGAEWYPSRLFALSASLGWESVYARTGLRDGPDWFRIHVGGSLVIPFMTPE